MVDLSDNQYEQPAYVFYKNWAPMVEFLKREHKIEFPDPEPEKAQYRAYTWMDESLRFPGKKIFYAFFWEMNRTIQSERDLAHEMLHMSAFILNHVGVKFSERSEEVYAYFLDHLIGKVREGIKENRKRGS